MSVNCQNPGSLLSGTAPCYLSNTRLGRHTASLGFLEKRKYFFWGNRSQFPRKLAHILVNIPNKIFQILRVITYVNLSRYVLSPTWIKDLSTCFRDSLSSFAFKWDSNIFNAYAGIYTTGIWRLYTSVFVAVNILIPRKFLFGTAIIMSISVRHRTCYAESSDKPSVWYSN